MARSARLVEHGKPLRVEEVELPVPGPDELLVELEFAGVNPVDGYNAQGTVAQDGPLPRTLGGEASGRVAGAPVLVYGGGLGSSRDGVWAGAAVVPKSAVYELPDGLDMREAAAAGVAGLTAWNVVELGRVGPEDRVLVLGASGGVGLTVVSLLASLGAKVWGQTTSEAKREAVKRQGAENVLVADARNLAQQVAQLAPTVVIDPLGSAYTAAALSSLVLGGRLVIFGASAGAEGTIDLRGLYRNRLTVLGYGGLSLSEEERRAGLTKALAAMADGRMNIPVDRVLPLSEVNEALALVAGRALVGKVLLDVGSREG